MNRFFSIRKVMRSVIGRRCGSSLKDRDFYTVYDTPQQLRTTVTGNKFDYSVDLTLARPGDAIDSPYEITVNSSFRDFWQSACYSYDRICTSTPFTRSIGLRDQVLPFHLMLFLTSSMSHADRAKMQVGFTNAVYHWPAFPGDTFCKRFVVQSLRSTSDMKNSIVDIRCELRNQRDVLTFSCDKTMMFPFSVPPSVVEAHFVPESVNPNAFLDFLVDKAKQLQEQGSQSMSPVRPGDLILHTLSRPVTVPHLMQLATLGRLTHDRHFNTHKYSESELLVPGGIVLGLTCSLSSRDLHEVTCIMYSSIRLIILIAPKLLFVNTEIPF